MLSSIPSEVLRHVREVNGISQATLAKLMGTVPSVLSKLEKADEADPEIAERYLTAIGSELATEVLAYYERDWLQRPPPSFLHPDHEHLWTIDEALKSLEGFEAKTQDPILRGPIDLLRGELRAAEAYLRRRDHTIAWIGDIGVGKTTALSYAVGLLVGDGRSGRKPAFPVGPGRTTVCETAIRVAPTYGILVDAFDDEVVLGLTRDLVSSLVPGATGVGVSAEIGRLLRNMAQMKVATTMVGDEMITKDPIVDLLSDGIGIDEVTDRIIGAMALRARTERQIILPEGSEDGLQWISRLVSNINSGQDARFSVPRRITVLMPSKHLNSDGQHLSVVDTKGVEGVTQRPDISLHSEDPRTLIVLCTKFADAPNATTQRHLRESMDAESDAHERRRQAILVLPRGDEALEVPGSDGPATSREHGYALRRKEIELALVNAQLPATPVYFFDARNDDADTIWKKLRIQIGEIRSSYAKRGAIAALGVNNLMENVDDVRATEARRDIEQEIASLLKELTALPGVVRPAYLNLIDQVAVGHHSSIAASIYRRGDWDNFQFAHILGTGVRNDAGLRMRKHVERIEHRLLDLTSKYEDMDGVAPTLSALGARLAEGRQEFLATARTIGRDAYGILLANEGDAWTRSADRYGQGSGYKQDIAGLWREYFETSEDARETAEAITERLQDAWKNWVIDPLHRATQAESNDL